MFLKCTIHDIARETGYSRNTVSKALKGRSDVSKRTIEIIVQKAKEMGYFTDDNNTENNNEKNTPQINKGAILFLTIDHANDSEFWSSVLTGIDSILSKNGYQLTISTLSKEDINVGRLPNQIFDPNIKGVIVVEMNFHQIWDPLLKLNIPIVTVDAPKNHEYLIGKCDIIMMENKSNISGITQLLIKEGRNDFAFIGDLFSPNTGYGFKERYTALVNTLDTYHLTLNENCSIIHDTDKIFNDFNSILKAIKQMESLPHVFICGNDWLAIQLIYGLQTLGYSIPKDVNVVGFDNISASERISPSLTTISTPKVYLGTMAACRIIERIENKNIPCVIAKYSTKLILRNSTLINLSNNN
jgi:LacI family transcriptional regulator